MEGFDYQTAWGLAHAMGLHTQKKNFAVAFEFHDDIVELSDADAPTMASFFQVKIKRSGNWTIGQLTSRKKSHGSSLGPSFAGRMLDNLRRFGSAAEKVVFVSNAPASGLPDGECQIVLASPDFAKRLKAALSAEAADFQGTHLDLFYFHRSALHLDSYDRTLLGDVTEFIEAETGLTETNSKAFMLAMVDQCRRRSKRLAELSDFEQLKASKFITRSDMSVWLNNLRDSYERRPEWTAVAAELDVPFAEKREISSEWGRYELERRRRTSAAAMRFRNDVRTIVERHMSGVHSMAAGLEAALPEVERLAREWEPTANSNYLKAMMLYEYWR